MEKIQVSSVVGEILRESIKLIVGSSVSIQIEGEDIKNENDELNNNLSLDELRKQITLVQELAIARRIETADEVEIEEYYGESSSSKADGKVTAQGIGIGAEMNGGNITKKVYKFKGYNDKRIEAYEQTRDKVLKLEAD